MTSTPGPAVPPLALTRKKERGSTERAKLDALLDEVLTGVVAVVVDGRPQAVPLLFARDGDRILVHGSSGAGTLRHLAAGAPAVFTVHTIDGLVVAENAFNSSANYRSAVVEGTFTALTGEPAWTALDAITDRLLPGRTGEVPPMTNQEVAATTILALAIEPGRWLYKERTGGAGEPENPSDVWRGVVPLALAAGEPVPEADSVERALPASVAGVLAGHRSPRPR